VDFVYDEDLRRIKETITDGGTQRSITMLHPDNQGGLGYEREETRVNGVLTRVENRHYVSVGGAVVAVVKTLNDSGAVSADPNLTLYWHKDALGSIVAVSDQSGNVLERMAFDPWGRRITEQGKVEAGINPSHGDRGFTGHEHLDEIGLVHMNGRMYDPVLGRFLSPDPFVQSPDELQNYNRYSYVLNSPLRYTDPSGNVIDWVAVKIFTAIIATAMIAEGNKHWKLVGSIALAWALGGADGLVEAGLGNAGELAYAATNVEYGAVTASAFNSGGVLNSMLAGGLTGLASSGGDLQSGIVGALSAGAFTSAGASLVGTQRVFAHAVIGCLQGAASGGKCGPSAMSAAFGKITSEAMTGPPSVGQFMASVFVGGTASVIGGGKFGNGAAQGAWGYLFNAMSEEARRRWIGAGGVAGGLLAAGGALGCTLTTAGGCSPSFALISTGVAGGALVGAGIANLLDWADGLTFNTSGRPFLPGDPYSPEEVGRRQSGTRAQEGARSLDPDSPIPNRGPGRDMGGHDSRGRTPHETGERNVNGNEEHSRRPKGNPSGTPRR
jgi:RHS repeat-associated protein